MLYKEREIDEGEKRKTNTGNFELTENLSETSLSGIID